MDWDKCVIEGAASVKCVEVIFLRILNIILPLALIALFIMLVMGGFKYLTSGGNPKTTASAQQTLTTAFAGVILIVLAYLVFYLIKVFSGVDILHFNIPN
jgi:hypothetical protein